MERLIQQERDRVAEAARVALGSGDVAGARTVISDHVQWLKDTFAEGKSVLERIEAEATLAERANLRLTQLGLAPDPQDVGFANGLRRAAKLLRDAVPPPPPR